MSCYFHWGDKQDYYHLNSIFLFREVTDVNKTFLCNYWSAYFLNYGYKTDEIHVCKTASREEMAKIPGYFQIEKIEVLFMRIHLAIP